MSETLGSRGSSPSSAVPSRTVQRGLKYVVNKSKSAIKAVASTTKKVTKVKSALSWISNNYEELVDPHTVLTRRDQEQEAEDLHRAGSWSSEDNDAVIKDGGSDKEKKLRQAAREKDRSKNRLQKQKKGYSRLGSDDEDIEFETSLPQKAKEKATESIGFEERDLVKEEDWKVKPVDRFMGEGSGKESRRV